MAAGESKPGHRIKNNLSVSTGGRVFAPNIQSDHSSGPMTISMGNKTIVNHYGGAYEKKLSGADLKNLKAIHKSKSKEAAEYMMEYEKTGKKRVLLRERFINVRITEGDSSEGEKAEERVIEYGKIFSPVSGQSREPVTVVTKGLAGMGKSVLVQKLIYDWATGAALSEYDFIFKFPFRELSLLSAEKKEINLPDLVKQYYPEIKRPASILANESIQTLFIFDGLSDGDLEVDFNKHIVHRDVSGAMPLGALLVNLIKKELVPKAAIWITTRPGSKNGIPTEYISRETTIKGFQDQEKEDYFLRRCKDKALGRKMSQVVKRQRNLFFMCSVPAFCSILFSVLETVLKSMSAENEIPQTLTEVYSHFLVCLILFQEEKLEFVDKNKQVKSLQSKRDSILALGKLSFERGHLKDCETVSFSVEELKQNNIQLSLVCSGLCEEAKGDKSNYSFVHLALQEYFAALYVFLAFYNQNKNAFGRSFKLFEKQGYSQICKEACDSAIKGGKRRQEFFLRFLCGLGTTKSQDILEGLLLAGDGKNKERDDSKKIAKFLKKTLQANIPPEQTIDILHCLNELNDISALEEIKTAFNSGSFSSGTLSPAQCSALAFVLQMSEESYQELDLSLYKLPTIGIRRLLLTANSFTGIKLSGANIRDCGLKILTDVMRSPDCKLQNVKLDGNNLTYKSCEQLVAALTENHNVILLDLTDNNIQDKGVSLLCNALKHEQCSLQMLSVGGNKLTSSCCKDLADMLSENKTLLELDLSHNRIGESGLQDLFKALKNGNWKLQKLGLNSIFAFEFGIMGTYEDASGAGIICDILESQNCKLQSLGLAKNSFTQDGCAKLIKSLKGNQTLTELDIGSNNLQNDGMTELCDILTEPGCKMQSLKVANAKLTSECCVKLASVFNIKTLTELDVSMNELGNDGVTELLSSLKDSQCQLQRLGLSKTGLTDAWSIDLKATFAKSNQLVELDLSHNKFTDKSVQRFSDFIVGCAKLKTIRMEKNRFSAKGYKTLEDLKMKKDDLHK